MSLKFLPLLALAIASVVASSPARAQGAPHGHHSGHSMPAAAPSAAESPAVKAYRDANARMHKGMEIPFTGDADVDFVRGMIPHHQGAVDMAKVVLQHGKDERIRQWATDIIREQEREIAALEAWLKSRGL